MNKSYDWWPSWDWAKNNNMPENMDDKSWLEFNNPENSDFVQSVIRIIKEVYNNKPLLELLKKSGQ